MNDQTNNNKGFLKDKLGDYQVNPPESVWESISDHLGGGRSRRNMLILVFAAAASLALAVTLGIHYFGPDLAQESVLAEEAGQGDIVQEDFPSQEASTEALSPLEQRVLKTLETVEADRLEDPGISEETRLSMAMEDQEILLGREEVPEEEVASDPEVVSEEEVASDQEVVSDQVWVPEQEAMTEQETLSDQQRPVDSLSLRVLTGEGEDQISDVVLADLMEDQKKDPRWMVGAVVSPLYSFRDAEASVMAGAGVHESGLLSYSSGVHVNYRRHSRLAFETGIFFNKTGLAIDASGIQAFNQQSDYLVFGAGSARADIKAVTNSVGNIISNSGEIFVNSYKLNASNNPEAIMYDALNNLGNSTSGIEQHLDYIELPFNLRYNVIDRTFELQIVGGLRNNVLVNNYVTMETSTGQQEIGYLSKIWSVNYSGNAGVGMIYHVGKKLNLMLEPRFRYFLNSINDPSLPSTRPYSIGLYTSLNFTF